VQVAQREDTGGKVFGMIVGIVGLWLLLNTLDIISLSLFSLWPLLLIGLGILLLVRASWQPPAPATEGGEVIAAFALMGGTRRVSTSRDFRGGKLTAILGGCEVDLRQAEIKGDSAVLDVFAFAGGINIRVPSGCVVENRVTPILGGVEDESSPTSPDGKKLILIGSVFMGGVELKN
jgi:predicted membrane protein